MISRCEFLLNDKCVRLCCIDTDLYRHRNKNSMCRNEMHSIHKNRGLLYSAKLLLLSLFFSELFD